MPLSIARAEESAGDLLDQIGFDALRRMAEASGVQDLVDFLLSPQDGIDGDLPGRLLRRLASAAEEGLLEALSALAVPVLAAVIVRLVLGKSNGALGLLCRLACGCELARRCARAIDIADEAMTAVARAANVASPVLAAALSLTGSTASAAMLSPLSALCADGIENLLAAVGLPMCALAAVVACAGGLSEGLRLDGMFEAIRRLTVWGVRLLVAAFVALLAIEGRLAAARDTASAHAVRQALRGMIPYIGGSVSESTGALLQSAATVRGTAGVTGMALAAGTCARPALRLMIHMVSLKLAAAILEPLADPGITRVIARFSSIAGMLVALCAGSGLMAVLLAGACLGFG